MMSFFSDNKYVCTYKAFVTLLCVCVAHTQRLLAVRRPADTTQW